MGIKATFIRLAGCNLCCPWCDTRDQFYDQLTIRELLERIHWPNVVITGGEPTMHAKNLECIINSIRASPGGRFIIHLETNGTATQIFDVDIVSISPKLGIHDYTSKEIQNMSDQIDRCMQGSIRGAFFKFVVGDWITEFEKINNFLEQHNFYDIPVCISPLADVPFNREAYLARVAELARVIMDFPPSNYRLTIQLHKLALVD